MLLTDLPDELLELIISFHVDPYKLFKQLLTIRHVNKTFYELIGSFDGLWKLLMKQLRNKENIDDPELYFPTHCFLDQLLFKTLKTKFKDFTQVPVIYNTTKGELVCYEEIDDEQLNLFEKFSEWIDAYSKENAFILKALIQLCLGREMIEHIGMAQVSFLIGMFFEKLLEPTVHWVQSWKEKPNETLEWKDELVFDKNLLEIIETNSVFDEDIAACWSEMDGIYSCIPRNSILFIIEKLNGINVKLHDSTVTCMVTHVMKRLRDCGIKSERMRFCDMGLKKNYIRTDSMESLIPNLSKCFYLQHLAVWINSPTLLEWCLNVRARSTTSLAHLSNNSELDIPLEPHVNTYIHDACGLTALHYAIQRGNFEMSSLLINKYLSNPFVESLIEYNGKKLTCFNICKLGEGSSEKEHILQLLQEKYGQVDLTFGTLEKVKDVERPNDLHKINLEKMGGEEGVDCYEPAPMREFVVAETMTDKYAFAEEIDEYSDESENEYGLSYEWATNEIKSQSSLKRKRDLNLDYIFDKNVAKIRKPIEDLESVNFSRFEKEYLETYHEYITEYDASYGDKDFIESYPHVKILKRKANSEESSSETGGEETKELEVSDENMTNEKCLKEEKSECGEINETDIGSEFILRKELTIPKNRMNGLIDEIGRDYKNDLFFMPNAKMLLQQAAENLITNNFEIAQDIASFSERDYVTGKDIALACSLIGCKVNPNVDVWNGRVKKKHYHSVDLLNIEINQIRSQLEKLVRDESILDVLTCIIEDKFQSTYLEEIQDNELDEDYQSICTFYSDDSMLSNVCLEDFGDGNIEETSYSATTPHTISNERQEVIYTENSDYFTVLENEREPKIRVIYSNDRETMLDWLDCGELL